MGKIAQNRVNTIACETHMQSTCKWILVECNNSVKQHVSCIRRISNAHIMRKYHENVQLQIQIQHTTQLYRYLQDQTTQDKQTPQFSASSPIFSQMPFNIAWSCYQLAAMAAPNQMALDIQHCEGSQIGGSSLQREHDIERSSSFCRQNNSKRDMIQYAQNEKRAKERPQETSNLCPFLPSWR